MKNLSIIGSTGSIGRQTLDAVDSLEDVNVTALSANSNVELLSEQIHKFRPDLACVTDESKYERLVELTRDVGTKILCGIDGLTAIAEYEKSDMLLTSVVGNVGLLPTVAAIKKGKRILLANKETLVTAGELIIPLASEYNVDIIPVDSEHSAIFQCLKGNDYKSIKKLILTASGGPFFGRNINELKNVTKEAALKHPNWSMGAKITIDSATLMNKGLEVIEAKWLFGVEADNIDVVVHRQSVVHSAVMYCDNSVVAQLGVPDMKLPISYAINYPRRVSAPVDELDLLSCSGLTFEKPDRGTFRCLDIALGALKQGGLAPAAMNAANEIAVDMFLHDKISFLRIGEIVEETLSGISLSGDVTLEGIVDCDMRARRYAAQLGSRV